ncbi:MAG: DNA polymerase III subunit delta [Betaproteobacteria bacterium]|nr:DNA polymerase III subunit delta [Betaproteobacteria bacterium]NBY14186.1 DNA polymerase III subunit delta [Betaproteobacteria bacterium]
MQLRLDPLLPESLAPSISSACQRRPPPTVIAVCSADPLLSDEACTVVRRVLREQGFTERESDTPDRSFDWRSWLANAHSPSLFSARRLLELRLPTGRPGIEGGKTLIAWAHAGSDQAMLLLRLPRLDRALSGTAWFSAVSEQGVVVSAPDMPSSSLPTWIAGRLKAQGLSAEPAAISWLAARCEGNLSAAHQEILKLAFIPRANAEEPITLEQMQASATDQARFNPFTLGETLLGRDAQRSLRVIRALREEGEALPILVWSVAQACRRLPPDQSLPALQALARIDTMVKGLSSEDPWMALERLALSLARPASMQTS